MKLLVDTVMGKPHQLAGSRIGKLVSSNRDALLCLIDQGIVSVAGFATSVLIGRLAPTQLGVYYIGMAMVLFARGFQQQLVSTPYTIFHHRKSDQLAAYRGSCLVQQVIFLAVTLAYLVVQILIASSGFILLGIACYTGWQIADWGYLSSESIEVMPTLIVLAALIPIVLMREIVRHYCFTHSKNSSALGLDTASSVIQILGIIGLGYLGFLSGATAWVVISLACLVALFFWYRLDGPSIELPGDHLKEDLKLNWSFGKWAVSGQFVGSLPSYLLPWLLLLATGVEGTSLFAAGMTLVGIANIFNTGMLNFLTPRAAQVYVEEGSVGLKRVLFRMYGLFLVVVGSFAVFVVIFGGSLAATIFGPDFAGLQSVLTLLVIAKLFEGFSHTASGGLFAMERIKANFWIDVVLMFVTITAAILLIKPLGVWGAAWTFLIGSVTGAVLRSILVVKFLGEDSTSGSSNV